MKRGAAWSAAAPLVLALAALAVRQATRSEPLPAARKFAASEFEPPAVFAIAARAPGVAQTFAVEPGAGAAVGRLLGEEGRISEQAYAVSGRLSIDASEANLALELAFDPARPPDAAPWSGLGRIELRGAGDACRPTAAPGTRACTLRATWSAAGIVHLELVDVAWIRLPGGSVRLQGVVSLDPQSRSPASGRPWDFANAPRAWLAFDLSLVPSP